MGFEGEKGSIPRVVKDCIQFIRDTGACGPSSLACRTTPTFILGMEDDGLFRRSPNSALLRQVKEAYDRGPHLLPFYPAVSTRCGVFQETSCLWKPLVTHTSLRYC
jgi:hypothetical protein